MTASIQQVQQGVSRYINEELAKKKSGPSRFVINFLDDLISPRLTQTLIDLQSVPLIASSIFDENGNIIISAIADAAHSALEKSNNRITAFGFVFDQSDIDKLITYITNY